jgi:hypothetical protein
VKIRLFMGYLGAALLAAPAAHGADTGLEHAVKATFLYKFGDFVSWPADAAAVPGAPVNICIAGDDPFGKLLDDAVAGKRIAWREIVLHRLNDSILRDGDAAACQILYAHGPRAADVLNAVGGKPVLTVTDAAPDTAKGVINFVLKDNRVRFEIDARAAAAVGLDISSQLLTLAIAVRRKD